MALILIDNYKPRVVSPKVGAYLWLIKKGYVQPKEKQWRTYAARVKKVYLNPANAPDDYLAEHPQAEHDTPVSLHAQERWVPLETRRDML